MGITCSKCECRCPPWSRKKDHLFDNPEQELFQEYFLKHSPASDPRYTLYNKFQITDYQSKWNITHDILYACKNSVLYKTFLKKKGSTEIYVAKIACYRPNEVECLRVARHPNIITLIDCYHNRYGMVLIFPYHCLGDLDSYLANSQFDASEKKEVTRQILGAVDYLHQKQIAHRDLKMENILVSQHNGELMVKLADFGFSCHHETNCQEFLGTSHYLAPEIVQHIDYDPFALDIWSLGILIHFLFYGRSPFSGRSRPELKQDILKSQLNLPEDPLGHLLYAMLQSNPKKRLTSSQCLQHDFFKV